MSCRVVTIAPEWSAFRDTARRLFAEEVAPESIVWTETHREGAQLGLLVDEPGASRAVGHKAIRVPRAFLEIAESASCHRDPAAWPWLYRLLWRIGRGERSVLDDAADADMSTILSMDRAVRRDAHKMTAFVRFRAVQEKNEERFIAWFEPRHRIVRRTAGFFKRRFPSMRWSILTPDECVHWDGSTLSFTDGVEGRPASPEDDLESFWLTYYAHTFNPARVRFSAMRAEMPIHYWRNLPEAAAISDLLRAAPGRVREMIERAEAAGGTADGQGSPAMADPSQSLDSRSPTKGGIDPRAATEAPNRPGIQRVSLLAPPAGLQPIRIPGVRVGVAGWDYPDWAGAVYPVGREGVDRLRWVASRFDLIEVNSTFYRPVSEKAARGWLHRVADRPELRFSAKLSRVFTHDRGLWKDSEVDAVKRGMGVLMEADRLVSLVVQFPWSFRDSAEGRRHLARIVSAFTGFPLHIEVRHASWTNSPLLGWLRERAIGIVNVDQPMFPDSVAPAGEVSGRVGYIRLHGRNVDNWFRSDAGRDERYDYEYSPAELVPWVARVQEMMAGEEVDEVEVVFNNHYRGQAVRNAEWFAAALKRELSSGHSAARTGVDLTAA